MAGIDQLSFNISSGGHGYCNCLYTKDESYLTESRWCPNERFLGNMERNYAKDKDIDS